MSVDSADFVCVEPRGGVSLADLSVVWSKCQTRRKSMPILFGAHHIQLRWRPVLEPEVDPIHYLIWSVK